jgi:uncharacterized protein (TIGR00369 family)
MSDDGNNTPEALELPLARLLGIRLKSVTKQQVVAELDVGEALCTRPAILHGGAIMALADTAGAIGAALNLAPGAKGTVTIESKTNFLGAAPLGERVTATATALHVGGRTQVWQTRIERTDGKPVAVVTQTQLTR